MSSNNLSQNVENLDNCESCTSENDRGVGGSRSSSGGEDGPLIADGDAEHSVNSRYCSRIEESRMKYKLKFFFMNPVEKWQAKRRIPLKFIVQVMKIILVTVQLCLFAHSRYSHVTYTWDNRIAFSHLFLRGWDASREVNSYPPGLGPLALYKIPEFFETLDFAVRGYSDLGNAIGPYSYTEENDSLSPPVFCLYKYKEGDIFGFNESYVFNSEIIERCFNFTNIEDHFSSQTYMNEQRIKIEFSSLVRAKLKFSVKTVNFKAAGPMTPPDCYRFDIEIDFDNRDHDGQMLLSLDADAVRLSCKGDMEYKVGNEIDLILCSLLNALVIIICIISFALCSRAVFRAQQLKWETMKFFKTTYKKELSVEGRLEFLNMWYIMIIVNDALIIIGSAIKEQIEKNEAASDLWNICGVLLGTGNLLVWFGVLRYLGFFKTYNVVILTLKKATPKVARFLLCAVLIYAGFTFCGWLILGPYHMKFRSLASTSECLFALINGDDMYATFSVMSYKSPMLWWYSRIYLYTFISLYIYVVLSLFISVIMDAYETIKLYYKDGFPKNDIQEFIADSDDSSTCSDSSFYLSGETVRGLLAEVCCCRRKNPLHTAKCKGVASGNSYSRGVNAWCV